MLNKPSFFLKKSIGLVVFFCLSFLICSEVSAQNNTKQKFQPDYDAKKTRFGYFLGLAMTNYNVRYSPYFLQPSQEKFFSVVSPKTYGLKMGGLMNIQINDNFDFRILPTVALYSRELSVNDDSLQFKQNDKAWFELPFMLKYKSLRRGNARMYMFTGVRLAFETNAVNLAKRNKLNNPLELKHNDFNLEYGAGVELFRQYFKLAPELHFSHGIRNLIVPFINPNSPLGVVDKLNTHTVTVYLFFE